MSTVTIPEHPFILIDGSSYLFRAYHALPPLTTQQGQPTGAMYGVINMIRKLLKDYPTDNIAVVFDTKAKTFRKELYPEYKANRETMPDELASQIEPLHNIIKSMGIPLIAIDGVEADDVIGTLAKQAEQHNLFTLISTGDKDLAQLVNTKTILINTMSNKILDHNGVIEKFGVEPHQIIDYLTLIGDTSDNIPGVPKVGPKTAAKWLGEHKSLDNIIKNSEKFTGKIGEHLRASLEYLPLSKKLVTLKLDVKLDLAPETIKLTNPDNTQLKNYYKNFEFKTWLKELENTNQEIEKNNKNYEIILTKNNFNQWLEKLNNSNIFAIDTETTSLDYMAAELVGISFCIEPAQAAYIPLAHDYMGAPEQLDKEFVLSQLKPILENPNIIKIGQNLKYDYHIFLNNNIKLQNIGFDTMLESYILNATATRHNMDALANYYLQKETIHFEDIAGKGAKQLTFNQIDLEQAGPYAAEDADITLQLHRTLWPKLEDDKLLEQVFSNIEMPLLEILARMEHYGVLINPENLIQQSSEIKVKLNNLEKQAFDLAGEEFNLSSTKQLQHIFYEKLELPILQKTPKGQPSTAESVLQELAHDYPLPKIIMEYRSLSKLKSTYTDKLPQQINSKTKRLHSSFHQAVTSTGRLSSSDPNLQNIPIRTEEGRKIRKAFIAPPGFKLVAADYSQIELRIMAHLSNDKNLVNAFAQGWDIHQATAAEVMGVELEDVTQEQRRSAKAVNFGLIYGMSAFGLAKQLDISREEAQSYINTYFERYPGVKTYMEASQQTARDLGYVETLFGRRLYLPDINASNPMRRKGAERVAINAPMQGTAADIIKIAMIQCQDWLDNHMPEAKMILQVHDELIFEVPEDNVEIFKPAIHSNMETAVDLSVPLIVEVGVGDNWDEAH